MPESLKNQFISDLYTSLLHLSGAALGPHINKVFDGAGNSTGLALSGKRVIINNYIYPKGWPRPQPSEWLDAFFPVDCLQLTFDDNNPKERIAGTDWVQVAQGRFLVGVGTHNDKNDDLRKFCPGAPDEGEGDSGNEAGEYMHELDINEIPSHNHQVNTGSNNVQIPSGVGTGKIFQSSDDIGKVDSVPTFIEQQQKRNILAGMIRWNFNSVPGASDSQKGFGYSGSSLANNFTVFPPNGPSLGRDDYLWPVKMGFDLNFMLGSSRQYDPTLEDAFRNSTNWGFKEVVGIWNGETRFIASEPAGSRNIPPGVSQDTEFLRNADWYNICKGLGCVDVQNATAGHFVTQNNEAPFVDGDADILNRMVGADNDQNSSYLGLGQPHNNIPPSYSVYVWRRIT